MGRGTKEMLQRLRVCAVLAKNLDLIPNIYM